MQRKTKGITINPLQTGGLLTDEAKETLVEFGDGYAICDFCKGTLDKIDNPPIRQFVHETLPAFLGADAARVTHGAREGKFSVMHTFTKPGDVILIDGNAHYSTVVAAERAGLKIIKVPHSGEPERILNVEDFIPLIKEHSPKMILLTYPDGNVGNLPDAKRLGEIAKEHGVLYVVNGAYAIGRMPISLGEIGCDFLIGSGHKSMAASGPVGVLATKKEHAERLFVESSHKGKELECLGCGVRGVPLLTLMASFPHVQERVKHWDEEVKKAQWFSERFEALHPGIKQKGEKPHRHDLMMFDTDVFYEISEKHPKKRGFLYHELKKNGIFGVKHGLTQSMKISTYGISKKDLERILKVFEDIIRTYA
ncbi:MAG: O-phospho-L-seryl-tRNA:Cys-tRNA synthase [Candidatus Woesearchaeota archaeon]